jgi:hypothetical protein
MSTGTLKQKLILLMRKSRQALHLYSGVTKSSKCPIIGNYLTNQAREWQKANIVLQKEIADLIQNFEQKKALSKLTITRELFRQIWRKAEKEEHQNFRELERVMTNGDYLTSLVLCGELITLKARKDAFYATYKELVKISRSKSEPNSITELTDHDTDEYFYELFTNAVRHSALKPDEDVSLVSEECEPDLSKDQTGNVIDFSSFKRP